MIEGTFCYTRFVASDRNWNALYEHLEASVLPTLAARGVQPWGAWSGLFGIASNELVLVTHATALDHATALTSSLTGLPGRLTEQHVLDATARPTDARRLTRQGLYVFRFFDVRSTDVEEIIALSSDAWTRFEASDAYRAQPLGLFREHAPRAERGVMLLCTWYDGFASWQMSRTPAPAATANFRRRHALTGGTVAYAVRLIDQNEVPHKHIA